MYRGAIGMIETEGGLGAVEAADAMSKCADVELIGRVEVGGGYCCVIIQGDVGSVKAALGAGTFAAKQLAKVFSYHLIPKPDAQITKLIPTLKLNAHGAASIQSARALRASRQSRLSQRPTSESLDQMNVHQLRSLARGLEDFQLKGREISKAKRSHLLELINHYFDSQKD